MFSKKKNVLIIYVTFVFATVIYDVRAQDFGQNDFSLHGNVDYESTMWCFQCNSGLDQDCAFIQPNETSSYHYKPCLDTDKYQGVKPFCRKIVQKIKVRDNMEIVIRKCGWVRHPRLDCYFMKNEDHEETICQCFDIGCNSSPTTWQLGPLATTLAGTVVYLVFGGQ